MDLEVSQKICLKIRGNNKAYLTWWNTVDINIQNNGQTWFICEGSICLAITICSFFSVAVLLILHLSCLLFIIFRERNSYLLIIVYKIYWVFVSSEAYLVHLLEYDYWLKYSYLSYASTLSCKYKKKHFYVKSIFSIMLLWVHSFVLLFP